MITLRPLQLVAVGVLFLVASCGPPALGTGTVAPAALPVAPPSVAQPSSKAKTTYLYVENNDSTIAAFAVAANGALSEISGSPYASNTTGPTSFSITVDPKGPYVLVTGTESNNVAFFSIGNGGALTAGSSSTDAGAGAGVPLLAKSDSRLYVVNEVNGGAVAAFDFVKNSKLKSIKGSPFAVTCPGFCTANPDDAVISGNYLYTVDQYGWYVSSFSIAPDGALTELNSYATHWGPNDAVLGKKGQYLYVSNGASADVSAYSVANGVLTELPGSPFPAGGSPAAITQTPNGKFVYVANQGDGTISGYSVKAGALVALPHSPFPDGNGTGPSAMTIDQNGSRLFVTNDGTSTMAVYAIAKTGAIKQIAGSPFGERNQGGPRGLALYEP